MLVRQVVDTRYETSPTGRDDLERLTKSPIRFQYRVGRNENFQSIVERLYNIEPAAAPSSYETLAAAVRDQNRIGDLSEIRAGQDIVLPYMPRRTDERNLTPSRIAMAKVQPSVALARILSGAEYDRTRNVFLTLPRSPQPVQITNALAVQYAWTTLRNALAMIDAGLLKEPDRGRVADQLVEIEWADANVASEVATGESVDESTAPPDPVFTDTDLTAIARLMASGPPLRRPVVYILDDSWPSEATFKEAQSFFREALKNVRNSYRLREISPAGVRFLEAASTDTPFGNTRTPHAQLVRMAVEDVSRHAPAAVQVVHIPLFTAQKFSKELLTELVELVHTAKNKQGDLENDVLATPQNVTSSRQVARDIVESIPPVIADRPPVTASGVIEATLFFAHLYASVSRAPFFVSSSWIATRYNVGFGPPAGAFGLSVAAVGNKRKNAMRDVVMLAFLGLDGGGIAVMNLRRSGEDYCRSSFWDPSQGTKIAGFVFHGELSNGQCGTSFSTPRVAWLLALREAYRPPTPPEDQSSWRTEARAAMLRLQDERRDDWLRYWLSPEKLLSAP